MFLGNAFEHEPGSRAGFVTFPGSLPRFCRFVWGAKNKPAFKKAEVK